MTASENSDACPAGAASASAKGSVCGHPWRLRLPGRSRRDFLFAKDAALRRFPPPAALLLLLRRAREATARSSPSSRAHVVPPNEEGDRLSIVDGLNAHRRRGRMERASGLHDLSDDRKAGDRSGGEYRGPFRQIDRILDVLGDDEVGIPRSVAPRQRVDEVRDRPSFLGLEGVDERRHGRAVQPGAHRPEDVLAGRASAERPALGEVRRADRIAPVVLQRWRGRSVAPAERAVALDAAGVDVELLPQLD